MHEEVAAYVSPDSVAMLRRVEELEAALAISRANEDRLAALVGEAFVLLLHAKSRDRERGCSS
ncbi:hypothetical protein JNW90_13310 [Micromonospora sp. STR1s_5]|nr:hypothetical protein [Micromonospora sp. STR1s_5]